MNQPRQVTFTVDVSNPRRARIYLEDGHGQGNDSVRVSDLTQDLADALGKTIERHIGDHDHHHHDHGTDHVHGSN
jgi:hypothetical protein